MSSPRQVHIFSGVGLPTNRGLRAYCTCGWSTTPRSTEPRAVAALETEHGYQDPVCVLCGRNRDEMIVPWARRYEHVRVEVDPATGDQFIVCRDDLQACQDLGRQQQMHLDRSALDALGLEPDRPGLRVVRPSRAVDR